MKSLKHIPEQILWHDGMLLSPQHFQQAFKRCESILQYQNFENLPYPFGIKTFKFEESAFLSGLLKIEEFEGTFQDGLTYYYNSNIDSSQLQLDLSPYKSILSKDALILNICIPKIQSKNSIINSNLSRYKSTNTDEKTFDENTGNDEIFIPRIKANVCFLFEHEVTSNYIALPVAKIYFENNFYKTKKFAFPATKVIRNSHIWNICQSISTLLRHKIQDIMEDLHKFDNENLKGIFYAKQHTLRAMKANLPRLEACLYSEQLHPFYLYIEIYNIYGQIMANDMYEVPPILIEYNHLNTLDCFEKIHSNIIELLEREVPSNFNITKITKIDNKFQLSIDLNSALLENKTHILFGLKKNHSVSHENFVNWIKSAIFCEEEQLSINIERRALGLSRNIIEKYDTLIPQRNVYLVYVKLENLKKEKISLTIAGSHDDKINILPDEVVLYSRKK